MKGKVSGVTVSVEGGGNGPEDMDTGVGPWNLMRISFFLQRSGILKRKLAITYITINRVRLILISCWNLLRKYYREKSGFLLLYVIHSTTSQMHFCESFFQMHFCASEAWEVLL